MAANCKILSQLVEPSYIEQIIRNYFADGKLLIDVGLLIPLFCAPQVKLKLVVDQHLEDAVRACKTPVRLINKWLVSHALELAEHYAEAILISSR